MGLMPQWDVLLLDEVTVDLDVLVRDELLSFLMDESETRGATVLCKSKLESFLRVVLLMLHARTSDATHIFDGLNHFPTHVAHMRLGEFVQPPQRWAPPLPGHGRSGPHLHEIALGWLKQDREFRRGLERKGRKVRGARKDDVSLHSICIACGLLLNAPSGPNRLGDILSKVRKPSTCRIFIPNLDFDL